MLLVEAGLLERLRQLRGVRLVLKAVVNGGVLAGGREIFVNPQVVVYLVRWAVID